VDRIDIKEFVSVIGSELEQIAQMTLKRRATAVAVSKPSEPGDTVEHESDADSRVGVLSTVDLEVQERLLRVAHAKWPFIAVLAEEETETRSLFNANSPYCLLLDPIDGTKQYLGGSPEFCHTVSLAYGTAMLVSLVYTHAQGRLLAAVSGQGAWVFSGGALREKVSIRPGERGVFLCHVSRVPEAVKTGLGRLGYEVRPSSQNATDILAMLDNDVAGFVSFCPNVYDVWSPAMIIQEAGGWLSDWRGEPLEFDRKSRLPHVLVSVFEDAARGVQSLLKEHLQP
jgi:fructose-1,6-bisphosphatase/inositol monophosphatase family enzyme